MHEPLPQDSASVAGANDERNELARACDQSLDAVTGNVVEDDGLLNRGDGEDNPEEVDQADRVTESSRSAGKLESNQ